MIRFTYSLRLYRSQQKIEEIRIPSQSSIYRLPPPPPPPPLPGLTTRRPVAFPRAKRRGWRARFARRCELRWAGSGFEPEEKSLEVSNSLSLYTYIYLSIYLPIYMNVYIYICLNLFVGVSRAELGPDSSLRKSRWKWATLSLSIHISIYLSIYLYIWMSIYICLNLFVGVSRAELGPDSSLRKSRWKWATLSLSLSIHLSIYLSTYIYECLYIYVSICSSVWAALSWVRIRAWGKVVGSEQLSLTLYIHLSIYLSTYIYECLYIYICLNLFVGVSRAELGPNSSLRKSRWKWATLSHSLYTSIYLSIYLYIWMSIYICLNLFVSVCRAELGPDSRLKTSGRKWASLSLSIHTYPYISTYICVCIWMSLYIYMSIYADRCGPRWAKSGFETERRIVGSKHPSLSLSIYIYLPKHVYIYECLSIYMSSLYMLIVVGRAELGPDSRLRKNRSK